MRVKLDETRFGKASPNAQAQAALMVALNNGETGPWFIREDGTVAAPGFTVGVYRDAAGTGEYGDDVDAIGRVMYAGKPLTWDIVGFLVQGEEVGLRSFRFLVGDQRSIVGLRHSLLEKLDRISELEGKTLRLEAEITRLVELGAIQQEEHRAELATTRELLAATQEKLRDARRKLAGLPVDPKA